jgi:hypothetical protein
VCALLVLDCGLFGNCQRIIYSWHQLVFDAAFPALSTKPGAKVANALVTNRQLKADVVNFLELRRDRLVRGS